MVRLLADENFNGDVIRGLRLRIPAIDLLRVQDLPIAGADDPSVLEWAAQNGRVLLTHDRTTMPVHALSRLDSGKLMPGVFLLSDRLPVGQAISEIQVVYECSETEEWNELIVYLPI